MIRKNRPIPGHTAKLLIFDLDGTLIDSREDLANSINAMLIHFGKKELPHEVIAQLHWRWRAHARPPFAGRS